MAVKKSKAAESAPAVASEALKKPKSKPRAKAAEAAPPPAPEPAPAPVVVAEAPAKKAPKLKAKAKAEAAPTPAPAPEPKAEAKPAKAPKPVAPAVKVTDKQKEFLKAISADSAGYLTSRKAEQKSLESLLEKKLIKKGAKDKASGTYRYVISKAGEKLITS